jgi:hypothetical protein
MIRKQRRVMYLLSGVCVTLLLTATLWLMPTPAPLRGSKDGPPHISLGLVNWIEARARVPSLTTWDWRFRPLGVMALMMLTTAVAFGTTLVAGALTRFGARPGVCDGCGYLLHGVAMKRCPECGEPSEVTRDRHQASRITGILPFFVPAAIGLPAPINAAIFGLWAWRVFTVADPATFPEAELAIAVVMVVIAGLSSAIVVVILLQSKKGGAGECPVQ